jgi:hypothetical protein
MGIDHSDASLLVQTTAPGLQKNPAPVTAVTGAEIPGRAQSSHGMPELAGYARELDMLNLLTFTIVAVALGMPLVVPLMWGPIETA